MQSIFTKKMPEEAGIPSKAVLEFVEKLKESQVEIHSFWMQYRESCIAEAYYKPFHRDFQHRMYSISKSLTGLAIGLLAEEGKIKLDDLICDYFRDKCPLKGAHPYIEAITIRDMLKMATAHQSTTYKRYDGDWVESFFRVMPSHLPGMVFNYDTSSAHVLAALVERLTGMELMDYLRGKFWNEIGCSKEAYFMKDPYGVSQGGSGLVCTTADIAAVAYLCTNDGKYGNRQLLPKDYLREAISKQIDTPMQPFWDENFGYGYQIWKNRKGGFTFYGMGGQLALCFPEYHFFMVTTANTIGRPADLQQIYNTFYDHIYPYLEEPLIERNRRLQHKLRTELENSCLSLVHGSKESKVSFFVNDKVYRLSNNPMNIKWFKLSLSQSGGRFIYQNHLGEQTIEFGNKTYKVQHFPGTELECITCGAWINEQNFFIKSIVIEEAFSSLQIQISFTDRQATLMMKKGIEPFMKDYEGIAVGKIE